VGNGEHGRKGSFPWIGCKNIVRFLMKIIELLQEKGYYTLNQVADQDTTRLWQQGSKNARSLGLEVETTDLWKLNTDSLHRSHIRLKDEDEYLAWSKNKFLAG
jgi:hypothetical protein